MKITRLFYLASDLQQSCLNPHQVVSHGYLSEVNTRRFKLVNCSCMMFLVCIRGRKMQNAKFTWLPRQELWSLSKVHLTSTKHLFPQYWVIYCKLTQHINNKNEDVPWEDFKKLLYDSISSGHNNSYIHTIKNRRNFLLIS